MAVSEGGWRWRRRKWRTLPTVSRSPAGFLMCLSGHVGMMAAGNNEGCSLVSFRRYKSRSTRAGKKNR